MEATFKKMEQKPRPWQQGELAGAWEGEVGLSEDIEDGQPSTTFCWIRKLSG